MTQLADLTWQQTQERAHSGAILAVPVGSTEQHGPHLPLSTDTDIALALAAGLAHARTDVIVAPAVAYGSSGEHADFAGTLSIGQPAIELLLVELGRSASRTFDSMVLVSAHGGNAEAVHRAVSRLRTESRNVLAWSPQWDGDAHAGRVETSMQLALSPGRVRLELAEPGNDRPMSELLSQLRAGGVASVSANGILGDPSGATAEEGELLIRQLTGDLCAAVAKWHDNPPGN